MGLTRSQSRDRSPRDLLVWAAQLLLVGGAYYIAARLSLRLALIERNVTPFWPPTGIALVGFLSFGLRMWPAVAAAAFLVNAPISPSLGVAGAIAVGNTLAPAAAVRLLRAVRFGKDLRRLKDALAIVVLAALPSTLISASVGSAALMASGAIARDAFAQTWSVWWTGDAMGILIVAPLLLTIGFVRRGPVPWRAVGEAAVLFAGLTGASLLLHATAFPVWVVVFPILGLIAWRFQLRGAAPAAFVVSSIAIWAAVADRGPFSGPLLDTMLGLQTFNAAVALTSLFLATLVAERTRVREALERAASGLEDTVAQRTAELTETNRRLAGEIQERVAAERALKHRESQLAEAQRVARVGSWEWDIEANRLTWSDELYRIHGLTPDTFDATYEGFVERVHPDDRDRVREAVDRALSERAPFSFDHRIVQPDGSERILHARGGVVVGVNGKPVRMSGTGQDVTDRRRAEASLRESEERYRTLVEHAPEAIVVLDVDAGRFVDVNAEAERLFEMPRRVLLRANPTDVSPDVQPDGRASREALQANIELALNGDTPQFEWLHQTVSGEPVLCEVRLLRLPAAGRRLVRGSIIDIRRRRAAEESLRESEERFRTVFESAAMGMAQCRPDGRILKVNGAFERLLGSPGAELEESAFVELLDPIDRDRCADLFERMIRGELAAFEIELRLRRSDGGLVWVHCSLSVVRDLDDHAKFAHLVVHDLTERRRAEALQRVEEERARLHAVFSRVPTAVVVTRGPHHEVEFANDAFVRVFGPRDVVGSELCETVPELDAFELMDRAFQTGTLVRADESRLAIDREPGSIDERFFNFVFQPLLGPEGTVDGILLNGVDVTEAVRSRRQVTESLAFLDTLLTTAPAGFAVFDKDMRFVRINERLAGMTGLPAEAHIGRTLRETVPSLAAGIESSIQTVLDLGEPVVDVEVGDERPIPGEERHWLVSSYPVIAPGEERLGVGLVVVEITERKRFERLLAAQKEVLELIARGAGLQPALETLARVAEELSAPDVRAAILLLDADGRRFRHGAAPNLDPGFVRAVDGAPPGREAVRSGAAIFDGEPVLVADIAVHPDWESLRAVALSHGLRSAWSAPIYATDGRPLGACCLYCTKARPPSQPEVELMQVLTHTAAIAIERDRAESERTALLERERQVQADLYQREHRIAETLQRSMLPERLPDLPDIEIVARYVPATTDVEIGGDWYDAISLPDGRLAAAIGDVAGHGIPAAATMGQMRMALRAYALEGHAPAVALAHLNAVLHELQPEAMATLLYLHLDPATGEYAFASAGHPPPLLLAPDGEGRFLEGGLAPPLGVAPGIEYREATGRLEPGWGIALYTDGLVERRRMPIDDGLERLRRAAAAAPPDLPDAADHLIRDTLDPHVNDDVALVLIRRVAFAGRRLRLCRPASPGTVPEIRHVLRRWLVENRADPEEVLDALVACSEACTNAIQHAYGPAGGVVEVEAAVRDGEVVIHVRDEGAWRAPRPSELDGGRGLVVMRATMDAVEVASGVDGTEVRMRRRLRAVGHDG